MGKGGGSQPDVPDPYETAAAESQFNRLDTYSPSGSGVRFGHTDAAGNFVQGLGPEGSQAAQQYIESDTERAMREALEPASLALTERVIADNITGLPDAARVSDRSDVAADIFARNYSLMEDAFGQESDRLLTNLQARGIPVGSEAFDEAYGKQQDQVGETLSRLAADANIAAGQEQSRQFGLDQAQRAGAISELVAAMGGGYNPPSSIPSGAAPNVNYSGLVGQQYQNQLGQYQADQQRASANAGALGSLGGAMLMKSDIRLKTDIVKVGENDGLNVYEYRYLWDKPGTVRRGYMAQEVMKKHPLAVWFTAKWMSIDYNMLPEVDYA